MISYDYGSSKYLLQYRPFSVERVKGVVLKNSAFPGVIGRKQLDELTTSAKASPQLRMNMDLRNGQEDESQRMLNALEPGTVIHYSRHHGSSETEVILRGRIRWIFYDDSGQETERVVLGADGEPRMLNVEKNRWHSLECLESGCVLYESKDGPYHPLEEDEIMVK